MNIGHQQLLRIGPKSKNTRDRTCQPGDGKMYYRSKEEKERYNRRCRLKERQEIFRRRRREGNGYRSKEEVEILIKQEELARKTATKEEKLARKTAEKDADKARKTAAKEADKARKTAAKKAEKKEKFDLLESRGNAVPVPQGFSFIDPQTQFYRDAGAIEETLKIVRMKNKPFGALGEAVVVAVCQNSSPIGKPLDAGYDKDLFGLRLEDGTIKYVHTEIKSARYSARDADVLFQHININHFDVIDMFAFNWFTTKGRWKTLLVRKKDFVRLVPPMKKQHQGLPGGFKNKVITFQGQNPEYWFNGGKFLTALKSLPDLKVIDATPQTTSEQIHAWLASD